MSRLDFFLCPEVAFQALLDAKLAPGTKLIFYRPKSQSFDAAIQTFCLEDENVALTYKDQGYVEYYLSLGSVPQNVHDWGFLNRVADEILVFAGGRLVKRNLELTELRIFSKQSRATANFNAVKKAIRARCTKKGVVTLRGTHYKNVYYSPEMANEYQWWLSLRMEFEDFRCRPSTPDD